MIQLHRAILFIALFMLLALVGGAFAQGTPDDFDGDGIPNSADRCPREAAPNTFDGCPRSPTLTPAPGRVDDRDGDGVLDFVDRCPDQAGTGFTEGCPSDAEPIPTAQAAPPFRFEPVAFVLNACIVGNPGPGNVNVRAEVPRNGEQTPIIGVLEEGDQFQPLYQLLDDNNTPWYASEWIADTPGTLGWVSSAVTVELPGCDDLPPPPAQPAYVDLRVCMMIVPEGVELPVYAEPLVNSPQTTLLQPRTFLPAVNARRDTENVSWLQLPNGGWVRADDVITDGRCDFDRPLLINRFVPVFGVDLSIEAIPYGGGGGGTCLITVPPGDGVVMYYVMLKDDGAAITLLQPGYAALASGAGIDANGNLWYALGAGWVDSSEVLASGNCSGLSLPPTTVDAECRVWVPTGSGGIPVRANATLTASEIGTLPEGTYQKAVARLVDTTNQVIWYAIQGVMSGWIDGTNAALLNPGVCANLPEGIPPADPDDCRLTVIAPTNISQIPDPDPAAQGGPMEPGATYTVLGVAVDDQGGIWYAIGGVWLPADDVILEGNCDDLPPYYPPQGYNCRVFVPLNGAAVNVHQTVNGVVIGSLPPGSNAVASFGAADFNGVRWYYVISNFDDVTTGWVNSLEIIENYPAVCDMLPPMFVINLDLFYEIELIPLDLPIPQEFLVAVSP